jgi:uncharacterized membrane protein YphA (DoxX/SURF4 family)
MEDGSTRARAYCGVHDTVSELPRLRTWILARDAALRADPATNRTALIAGAIFVVAGLVKFVAFGWELDAFRRFGLPAPEAFVVAAGVLETAGGLLLLARRGIAPVAALLSVTMLVAIGVSGIGSGDVIPSLTLAPALLLAMVFLLVRALSRPTASAW